MGDEGHEVWFVHGEAVNTDMPTGEIGYWEGMNVLNTADTPPFQLDEHAKAGEEVRLKHRYMDLRRPEMLEI